MEEDYYKILGIDKSASDSQIKSAYRKMAKKYHPDMNKNDKSAEEKFKKVSEAYAVLSDSEKKKNYDMFGSEKFHQRFSQDDIFRDSNIEDMLRGFGFGDIFGGGVHFGGGRGGSPFGGGTPPNLDLTSTISISLEESVKGGERQVNLQTGGRSESLKVKIPQGIGNGGKLRLTGKGNAQGSRRGNLYIEVHIEPHPSIRREGNNLIVKKEVTVSTALLGESVSIETFDGTKRIKIPKLTSHGQKIRIKGEGVKPLKGVKGDLYIEIIYTLPKKLTKAQTDLLEQLKKTGI